VCCSVLYCVAASWGVLQCAGVCCSELQCVGVCTAAYFIPVLVCWSVVQWVGVCSVRCSEMECVIVNMVHGERQFDVWLCRVLDQRCSVLECFEVCHCVLQRMGSTHAAVRVFYAWYASRHASFICATWLIYICDMTHLHVRHDLFICATWLIYMCDMTHLCVQHISSIRAICLTTCLIHICNMPHSYMQHASFIYATCLIHICDMNHLYVRHASFIYATNLIHRCGMGWLRFVGSFKI